MSSVNVNKELTDFGRRIKTIAILTLLSLILGIIGAFAIIFGIVSYIFDFIIIIFFLLVLGNIKRAGRELNNKELLDFSPRFFWGTIIRFIGQIFWGTGWWLLRELIARRITSRPLGPFILIVVIGAILIIIGSILRYQAWSGLATFFESNIELFTQNISGNANTGAKLCKIATIFDMTIILWFVGEILRIIGYFMLAITRKLGQGQGQPVDQAVAPLPAPTPTSGAVSPSFCPSCGSSIVSVARFCPQCGSEIS